MEYFFFLLFLKILIPVLLFYIGMKVWNKLSEKRTNYSDEYLNFENWYRIEFSNSSQEGEVENKLNENFPKEYYLLVSELPYKYNSMCKILEIETYLSWSILKKQYRKMVQMYHPDKMPQNDLKKIEFATKKLIKVKSAYETLNEGYFQK